MFKPFHLHHCFFKAFRTEFFQKSLFAVRDPRNESETVDRRVFAFGILINEGKTRCFASQKIASVLFVKFRQASAIVHEAPVSLRSFKTTAWVRSGCSETRVSQCRRLPLCIWASSLYPHRTAPQTVLSAATSEYEYTK